MIVLDTNVRSELMRPTPSPRVVAWLDEQGTGEIYTSALTQAEILLGLALMPEGQRRNALSAAAVSMFADEFGGRILPFDSLCTGHFAHNRCRQTRRGPADRAD